MAFLQRPLKAVFGMFSSKRTIDAQQAPTKRSALDAFESFDSSDPIQQSKRQRTETFTDQLRDMVKVDSESRDVLPERSITDRALMPPPSKHHKGHRHRLSTSKQQEISLDIADSASQATRSSRAVKSEMLDEYDMEEARRKAAATQLPPNSGIWETGERELFFHLSYRGFEPILPKNWMIDFPTLPLPVFAHQESDEPLILCHRSTHFRGIRAMRELLDTGTSIRDRTASNKSLRTEPMLEKAVNKYITWALKDLGYPCNPSKTTIPVHTVATLRPGQSTHAVIRRLASEMHILAAKHREAVNVQTSVEPLESNTLTPPNSQLGPTQIHPDKGDGERALPVIYGVMIASSILAIFTLNSHTPFPPFLVRTLLQNRQPSLTPERAAAINPYLPAQLGDLSIQEQVTNPTTHEEDSGIRYIASFDFSNASADVWNALVVAILAMQIRKTMGEVFETWQGVRKEQERWPSSLHGDAGSDSDESGAHLPAVEDSWLSNVNGDWSGLMPSSPGDGLVDQLLSSSSRPRKSSGARGKRKAKT